MLLSLAPPAWTGQTLRYRTRPRPKRAFHTVLDAAELLAETSTTSARLDASNGSLLLQFGIDLRRGRMEDRIEHDRSMSIRRLERRITSTDGGPSRDEIVDFTSSTH